MAEDMLAEIMRRLDALEKKVAEQAAAAPRKKDWRRVLGMFTDSELMKQVDAEGQAIREADRQSARGGSAE